MYNVEHIGIAVKSLQQSDQLFQRLLGISPYKREYVADQLVTTSFFMSGNVKVELLEASDPDSPIQKFLEKRGEGIHHLAFEVADIRAEMIRLEAEGFQLLQEHPVRGADNKWVCFIHPGSANGVLIELCQTIEEDSKLVPDALES